MSSGMVQQQHISVQRDIMIHSLVPLLRMVDDSVFRSLFDEIDF